MQFGTEFVLHSYTDFNEFCLRIIFLHSSCKRRETPPDFPVNGSRPEKGANLAYRHTTRMLSINYSPIKGLAADSEHGVLFRS